MVAAKGSTSAAMRSAKVGGLFYVSDAAAGIRRRRRGRGFEYLRPKGRPVRDARVLERIRSLVIPPAWTEVWICTRSKGHIQATGRDARGRKQYLYLVEPRLWPADNFLARKRHCICETISHCSGESLFITVTIMVATMLTVETASVPVWRLVRVPRFDKLATNTQADVCVVGAGIAGLSAAYLLAKAGQSVVVVDAASLAGGETARTTAHLTDVLDKRYYTLEWLHGEHGARLAAASHRAAIARIESIVESEQIECDFARVDGYLFNGPDESIDTLRREWQAARRAGLEAEVVEHSALPGFATGRCLRFPEQAQFHPLKYLASLARAITRMGGRIFTETQVKSVTGGSTTNVETAEQFQITAGATIVATDTPINDWVAMHTKQASYRSYVIGLHVPKGTIEPALYWDTESPYHYIRIQPGEAESDDDLLIVGGEDHKTGQDDDPEHRYERLEQWARDRFPMAGEVDYRWSGQIVEPNDGLAYIGRNPGDDNVYIVTGTSGNGMTYGTIAGMLLTDLILGRENPWADVYEPSRITLRASGEFLRENLNAAARYADYLTGGDFDSPDAIPRGNGGIIRRGMSKVAVYRDDAGTLHELSAVCPHLGGVVHWNPSEKSWDCPLHGSRFNATGRVINGPAISDLKRADESGSK